MNRSSGGNFGIVLAALTLFVFEPAAADDFRSEAWRSSVDNIVRLAESKFAGGPPRNDASASESSSDKLGRSSRGSKFNQFRPPGYGGPQTEKEERTEQEQFIRSGDCTAGERQCQVGEVMRCACREEWWEIDRQERMVLICEWNEVGRRCGEPLRPVTEEGTNREEADEAAENSFQKSPGFRPKHPIEKSGEPAGALDKFTGGPSRSGVATRERSSRKPGMSNKGSKFAGGPPKRGTPQAAKGEAQGPQSMKGQQPHKEQSRRPGNCTTAAIGQRQCQVGKVMECGCREEQKEIDGQKKRVTICGWKHVEELCGEQSKLITDEMKKVMNQRGADEDARNILEGNQATQGAADSGLKGAFEKGKEATQAHEALAPGVGPGKVDHSTPDMGGSDNLGEVK